MSDLDFTMHPAAISAETVDNQAGTLSRMYDAATKGTVGAVASGTLSIINTVLDYAGMDEISVEDTLRKIDDGYGDYYAENETAVDIVGFVGGALFPATWGIKAARLASAGTGLGAVGRAMAMPASRKAHYLDAALKEMATSGGGINSILSANRRKHLAWEVADQAMLGAAAEIAVVGFMHDSPVFKDDTLGDFTMNGLIGITASGLIGGPLGALGARGILKAAEREVQAVSRNFDVVNRHDSMGLTKGTELLAFAESIAKLPDNFADTTFKYKLDGVARQTELPLAGVMQDLRARSTKLAEEKLAIEFNALAGDNPIMGQAYYKFMVEARDAAKAAGKDANETMQLIAGYLGNVKSVGHVDVSLGSKVNKFYVALTPDVVGVESLESLGKKFSTTGGKGFSKQAYKLADDIDAADLRIGTFDEFGPGLAKQFRANADIDMLKMPDGGYRVNPLSKNILRVIENPYQVRMFMNLATGTVTPEVAAVFADTLRATGAQIGDTFISSGSKATTFKMSAQQAIDIASPQLATTARWAWASKQSGTALLRIIDNRVDVDDLPILQRLVELEPTLSAKTLERIKFIERGKEVDRTGLPGLRELLETRRYALLEEGLERMSKGTEGVPSVEVLAAHLNVDTKWIEEAIDRGFRPPTALEKVQGRTLETAAALQPKNIRIDWDLSPARGHVTAEEAYNRNMGPAHLATKELTREYQITVRQQVNERAANLALGEDAHLFPDLNTLTGGVSVEGAGATTLGAANASYGETAKLMVQETGKSVALVTQRARDAVVELLAPHINKLREDPRSAAELGMVTNALRRSPHNFTWDFTSAQGNRIISTEVATRLKAGENLQDVLGTLDNTVHPHVFTIDDMAVVKFLEAGTQRNHARQDRFTLLKNAVGLTREVPEFPIIKAPPINTTKYPHVAIIRTKEKVGLASDSTMVTAHSQEQLRELTGKVDTSKYDVLYKGQTEDFHKAAGDYEYQLGLNNSKIDSDLLRSGALSNYFPPVRAENVLTDWLEWHVKQEEKLIRTAVEVKNRQFFSEVKHLSELYRRESESMFRGIGSAARKKIDDPFDDYIKTALNISKQQEIPLLDALNEFVDKVGMKAGDAFERAFRDANVGHYIDSNGKKVPFTWEDANAVADRYGMGLPYKDIDSFIAANERFPRNLIRESFQKANSWLATATLRLDFANSLINIISTPIMLGTEMQSIKGLIANDSGLAGKLRELTHIKVPGKDFSVPSTLKLLTAATTNYFGPDKLQRIQRYRDIGAIKDVSQLFHEVLDDLSFRPQLAGKDWHKKVGAAVEKGAKITGNTFSEEFTRFVTADVMAQLTDPLVKAGKLTVKEQNAYIGTFVNRVQGNYVTSQRPIIFQGTTGAAVSLFQTYAFNVLQQLHRHMQAGDKKTLAVFAGLQSSVFGFNGIPFFDAVNKHLVGSMVSNNPEHHDAYNVVPGALGKELGDWMMYGTASAFPLFAGSSPALYTRGDINPRHATILPSDISAIPAVSAGIRLAETVYNFGKNLGGGMDMSDALLQGLQTHGLNRPLAGFAQVLAGRSTTSKGSLISAASELETTSYLGALSERSTLVDGVTRLMGARPMDEAVALNNMYRNKTYEALDRARLERLGTVVKSKLYGGAVPTTEEMEDFMLRYTRTGGRIENFNQFMLRATRDANVSVVNQALAKTDTAYGRKLKSIMGAEPLPDYLSSGAPETPAEE